MPKSTVSKRTYSSYETQRIILVVLLAGLIISAIIFLYQTRPNGGNTGNPIPGAIEESSIIIEDEAL